VPHVTFANALPWWALLLVLVAIAGISWLAYARCAVAPRRRAALVALRFITMALLLVFLLRPLRSTVDGRHDAVVPILVDQSRSMSIDDAGGERRIDRARHIVAQTLVPAIAPHYQVEVLGFGDSLKATNPADLNAAGRRSDLAGALAEIRERYRGRPLAGIVLVSDGGDTGAGRVPERTPPVYAIGVGSPTVGHDREVLSVTVAEAIFDDSRIDLAVSAVSHGQGVEPFALQLLENGRPVEVRRVAPVAEGIPVRTVFRVAPAPGQAVRYTVDIPLAPGELVPENNRRGVLVQAPSRVRHVLFLEGAPGFEHSFLKRAWAADAALDVDSVVRKGRNEQGVDTFYIQASRSRTAALTGGFPARIEDLFAYDALVLANVEAGQLTREQQEMTRAFVALRGGGVLVMGARSFVKPGLAGTALEELLPLELSDQSDVVLPASPRGINRVSLTQAGESHPMMQLGTDAAEARKRWDAAPALASTAPLGGPRPGASVLAVSGGAGGATRALVAVQRYGEGRSMVFTGEASWRWRMLLPSSDRSYDTFWRQALRWLAVRSTDPVAIAVPAGASPGETLSVRVAVRNRAFVPQTDATVDVRVTSPDGRTHTLPAAAARRDHEQDVESGYVAPFQPPTPGVYLVSVEARQGTVALGSASASVLVGGADLEMADPRLNTQLLQRIALGSGGRLVAPDETSTILDGLRAGLPAARLAASHDLWHSGWSFAAIVMLLGAEWMLRRRWGLR
jgi:uncharacterized membrane protein